MNLLVQIFGSLGGLSFLAVVINAIANRRKVDAGATKLGADAAKLITDAAAGVSADLRIDNRALREELHEAKDRITELERRDARRDHHEQQLREQLQVHRAWDISVALQLRNAGLVVPEPPDLLPDVMRNG